MKKLSLLSFALVLIQFATAQVSYYKTEWTLKNKDDLFTGICRIDIKGETVKAELVWIYWAIDSTDEGMMNLYKGKKGKSGVEYAEGDYNAATNDISFAGRKKDDPYEIIGTDIYSLKFSANRQVLYGTTATGGTNNGLFYGIKLNNATGEKEFLAAKGKLKRKS